MGTTPLPSLALPSSLGALATSTSAAAAGSCAMAALTSAAVLMRVPPLSVARWTVMAGPALVTESTALGVPGST